MGARMKFHALLSDMLYNSRVVLYGIGKMGKSFLKQYCKLRLFDIVAITDRNAANLRSIENIKVIMPHKIMQEQYDFVIIAVKADYVIKEIENKLINELGVDRNKIIYLKNFIDMHSLKGTLLRVKYNVRDESFSYSSKSSISMAICAPCGIGDLIIYKRFINAFVEENDAERNVLIDLFVPHKFIEQIRFLYSDVKYIHIIDDRLYLYEQWHLYDLSIRLGYLVNIDNMDVARLYEINEKFAACWEKIGNGIEKLGMGENKDLYRYFAHCYFNNVNCYTVYNYGGALHIDDYHTSIPLTGNRDLVREYVGTDKYITINFGCSYSDEQQNSLPAKLWLYKYWVALIDMLKRSYDYKVIQLGISGNKIIPGVDMCCFDYGLDVVGSILKYSTLHIDGEGGLVHLASQLDTKCAVIFGPTPVHYFGYENNINITPDGCCNCLYVEGNMTVSCPRGDKIPHCMSSILPEMVLKKVEECLT